jgi:hypothetical protein
MNNQTMALLPTELFFSLSRLAAIFSLLFIAILVLITIFLLFNQQRNASIYDEHELASETGPTATENTTLELTNVKQYDNMNAFQSEIDEEKIQSTANLISSK